MPFDQQNLLTFQSNTIYKLPTLSSKRCHCLIMSSRLAGPGAQSALMGMWRNVLACSFVHACTMCTPVLAFLASFFATTKRKNCGTKSTEVQTLGTAYSTGGRPGCMYTYVCITIHMRYWLSNVKREGIRKYTEHFLRRRLEIESSLLP